VLGLPLLLTGSFIQTSGATLQVVVTPSLSSQFIITGNAALAGGIKYVFAPGIYAAHVYDFLTATGAVTGKYSTVTYGGAAPTIFTRSTNIMPGGADLVLAGSGTQNTGPAAPAGSSPAAGGTPAVPQVAGVVAPEDGSLFSAEPQMLAEITQQDTGMLLGKAAQGAAAGNDDCAAAAEMSAAGDIAERHQPGGGIRQHGGPGGLRRGRVGGGHRRRAERRCLRRRAKLFSRYRRFHGGHRPRGERCRYAAWAGGGV
jgi:hypothetical protein